MIVLTIVCEPQLRFPVRQDPFDCGARTQYIEYLHTTELRAEGKDTYALYVQELKPALVSYRSGARFNVIQGPRQYHVESAK
jgi:hypothetical protein